MFSSASVKRLRSFNQEASADDTGPSPNTAKRLRTRASKQVAEQVMTLSQQAIDAIESVAANSEQNTEPCSPDLDCHVQPGKTHTSKPNANNSLQQQISEQKATINAQKKFTDNLTVSLYYLTRLLSCLANLMSLF